MREQNGLTLICWTKGAGVLPGCHLSVLCFSSYQYYKLCMHVYILEVHIFFGLTRGAIVKKDEQIMRRK